MVTHWKKYVFRLKNWKKIQLEFPARKIYLHANFWFNDVKNVTESSFYMPKTVFQGIRENIKTVSRNKMELSYIVYHPKWNAAL